VVERQISQLTRLVDDLVDVHRVTHGKVTLKRAVVDLGNLVSEAMETCGPLIDERHHNVEVCLSTQPLPVDVDATRITQAVINLITNAAKYTPCGGRISVSTDCEKDRAVLHVRDSGVGIPAPLLPKIFDLFVQGERPLDRPEGGLGIGLTIVKQIIELHGGCVSAFSKGPNQGSEFVAYLPLANADRLAATSKREEKPTLPRTRRRLLLVEDNRDSAATLASLLELAGHEVRVVHDGRRALPLFAGLPATGCSHGYRRPRPERLRSGSPVQGVARICTDSTDRIDRLRRR
jgi:CheY-like chemotaxis protein